MSDEQVPEGNIQISLTLQIDVRLHTTLTRSLRITFSASSVEYNIVRDYTAISEQPTPSHNGHIPYAPAYPNVSAGASPSRQGPA